MKERTCRSSNSQTRAMQRSLSSLSENERQLTRLTREIIKMCDHPNGNFVHHKTPADFFVISGIAGETGAPPPGEECSVAEFA